ncbi:hypothetical protein JTB14_013386 [Gonioctena quinquepunctata]|nr:hypothetical protein JTB14_008023 [Gonioctena quinquepunctata]KAG5869937.1 hypothetical protein JTB14_013386 [Gonioctena quinquepunctata]
MKHKRDVKRRVQMMRAKGAWNNLIADYEVFCDSVTHDLTTCIYYIHKPIRDLMKKELERKKSTKVQLVAGVQYHELNLKCFVTGFNKQPFQSEVHQIVGSYGDIINGALVESKNEIEVKFAAHSK